MVRFIALALAALMTASPAAPGERPAGVVELFTSQGCNSCPAADEVLLDMAREGRLVALGYHVDYWDYLGWKDTLSVPQLTERQRAYARSFKSPSVYTPQAVLNGRAHVNGADRPQMERTLAELEEAGKGLRVDVTIERTENSVILRAGRGDLTLGDAHLVLVFFDKETPVTIERGENRGRTITYANVVTGMQTAGVWHGEPVEYELPTSELVRQGSGGCAVLLQSVQEDNGLPGRIIGAALMHYE